MLYCCSASIALADIDIEETFTHYDINPKKASDIVFELRERSPVRKNNRTFHGSAEWELRPLFQWKRIGKLCYVEDFSVKVKTEYTMPQLASGKSFDESVKVKFDKFYDALLVHEKGHSEFGIKAANEIYQLLDNVKPVQGCKVLKKRVTRDINEIIETYDKLNQAYDVETGHGRTQGAVIS
jgi:predicted secreted Zn-dependent protease